MLGAPRLYSKALSGGPAFRECGPCRAVSCKKRGRLRRKEEVREPRGRDPRPTHRQQPQRGGGAWAEGWQEPCEFCEDDSMGENPEARNSKQMIRWEG